MLICPQCAAENSTTSSFCTHCGAPLAVVGQPTVDHQPSPVAIARSRQPPSSANFPTSEHGRFEPGTRLGQRYRIVAMLGRGGMGEVYRADDLELGQSVALKFLPESVARDPETLQQFRSEVRTARQIAHPNVCRTYDIGEVDGHVFLSMEYVDGEDLAHVLRRMGRPSKEKALEIARQLCVGLAAAHENGVLHRDLKPANVMIDGRGRVRITDFGLAAVVDQLHAHHELAGTPAYMAPEQLSSGTISVRSDVYALGLVLYEIFTGRRVHDTNNISELRELHSSSSINMPSSVVDEMDPAIERVIERCLQKDPTQRPASVYAVLGALPGGDPLTAALAAGETPSPELVAEAGDAKGLSPRLILGGLVASLLLLILNVGMAPQFRIDRYVPLPKTEDDLVFQARELLAQLGYDKLPKFRAHGFDADTDVLKYVAETDVNPGRWARLPAADRPAVLFWYRTGPEPVMGTSLHATHVGRRDPPLSASGSALVELDPEGALTYLACVPEPPEAEADSIQPPTDSDLPAKFDLSPVFTAAGLDERDFMEADPITPPHVFCDQLRAFVARDAEQAPGRKVIQIGTYRGRVNMFQIVTPWIKQAPPIEPPGPVFVFGVVISGLVVFIAMRNLVVGRGDRRGAFKLAAFIVVTMMLGWAIQGVVASGSPHQLFINIIYEKPLGHALQHALLAWLLYVALEPFVRRYWPWTLVTWTRLLMGRFRDLQLGRDILVGGLLAGVLGVCGWLSTQLVAWAGRPLPEPFPLGQLSLGANLEQVILYAHTSVIFPMGILILLVVARVLLRNARASVLAVFFVLAFLSVTWAYGQSNDIGGVAISSVVAVFCQGALLYVLLQFGLLPVVVAQFILTSLSGAVSWDISVWYTGAALARVAICGLLLLYGYHVALGGRSLFEETVSAQ